MAEMKNSALCLLLFIGSGVVGSMGLLEDGTGQPWFGFAVVFFVASCLFDTSERASRD